MEPGFASLARKYIGSRYSKMTPQNRLRRILRYYPLRDMYEEWGKIADNLDNLATRLSDEFADKTSYEAMTSFEKVDIELKNYPFNTWLRALKHNIDKSSRNK